tara:strand:+ start:192 stop:506 length:315 start_codon:yes stop_codon:yes gene_type:complete
LFSKIYHTKVNNAQRFTNIFKLILKSEQKQCFYSFMGYIFEIDKFANKCRINEINEIDVLVFYNTNSIDLCWLTSKNQPIKPPKFFGIMENHIGFAKAKPLNIY